MHTATLKSAEGCASKEAGGPACQHFTGQEGQGGGGPGLQEKHLGLRKHSPDKPKFRSMEKRGGGWLKAQDPRPVLYPILLPRCGDICGCPADTWSWTFCCQACTSPWPRVAPWKEIPRLQTAYCPVPEMNEGEARGSGIFWFPIPGNSFLLI